PSKKYASYIRLPNRFWHDQSNHRQYFDWLAERLEICDIKDWYGITWKDVAKQNGASVLNVYKGSLVRALTSVYPNSEWEVWTFERDDLKSQIENKINCNEFIEEAEESTKILIMD